MCDFYFCYVLLLMPPGAFFFLHVLLMNLFESKRNEQQSNDYPHNVEHKQSNHNESHNQQPQFCSKCQCNWWFYDVRCLGRVLADNVIVWMQLLKVISNSLAT